MSRSEKTLKSIRRDDDKINGGESSNVERSKSSVLVFFWEKNAKSGV